MLSHTYAALLLLSTAAVDAFTKLEVTDFTLPLRRRPIELHVEKRHVTSTPLRRGPYQLPVMDVIVGGQTLSLLVGRAQPSSTQ
jgi:hypothetical protein